MRGILTFNLYFAEWVKTVALQKEKREVCLCSNRKHRHLSNQRWNSNLAILNQRCAVCIRST